MTPILFQTITDPRGKLTVIERLPFEIKRVYYLHNIEGARGGHAHRNLDRVLVAVSGSLRMTADNGDGGMESEVLSNPGIGLRVPPMTWIRLYDFSRDAVCLVLASAEYDPADYIRDRAEFDALVRS